MALRKGRRATPADLEFNKGVTIKVVNAEMKISGYIMKFAGYDEDYDWPVYRIDRLPGTKYAIKDPFVRVYAIGDYTVAEWIHILNVRLIGTCVQASRAAVRRRYRAKKRREKNG